MLSSECCSSNLKLNGGCHSLAQRLWKVNLGEESRRVQVVFSGLVNDPDLLMLGGLAVGKYLIEFATFKGHFVALIVETDDESLGCWHTFLNPGNA